MDITGIGSVLDFGGKILDKIFPDPAQKAAAQLELYKAQQAGEFKEMDQAFALMQGQQDINKVEAANASLFVAGWRPAIGWVCASALGYQYIARPILTIVFGYYKIDVPVVGLDNNLWELMFGMLGMGGLRTYQRINGVERK